MAMLLDAFVVMICCISCFKYFKLHPTGSILVNTFGRAVYTLISFTAIFAMVFLGFVLLFHNLYGQQIKQFRKVTTTAKSLLVTLLGNVDYEDLFFHYPVYAQWLFILYIIVVYFVLLNMFVAILNEAHIAAQKWAEENKNTAPQVTWELVREAFWEGICCCLVKESSRGARELRQRQSMQAELEAQKLAASIKALNTAEGT